MILSNRTRKLPEEEEGDVEEEAEEAVDQLEPGGDAGLARIDRRHIQE